MELSFKAMTPTERRDRDLQMLPPRELHPESRPGSQQQSIDTSNLAGAGANGRETEVRPARKPSFYIPSLDGIRAAAVLLVFVAHAGLSDRVPGNFGVTVFFFLSGYLITTLLRMEFDKTGGISLKEFYLRRALRILPPFYLVLVGASLLTFSGKLDGSLHAGALLAQACHLSNYYVIFHGWWTGRAPGTWIFWSLAVEEHFYLIFPCIYLFLRRYVPSRRQQMLILFGLCGLVLIWRCVLVLVLHAAKDRTYVATDTRLDSILFGCILAVYGNPMLDAPRIADRWLKTFWIPASLVVLAATFISRNHHFQETFRYSLQGIALFPLFIAAIRLHDWGPFRVLNLRWVKFIGILSYSFYLLHPTILYCLWQWTHWNVIVRGVMALALSVGIASLIYYFVEKPCARLRKRLSRIGASSMQPRGAAA